MTTTLSTSDLQTTALRTPRLIGLERFLNDLQTFTRQGDLTKPRVIFITTDAERFPRGGFGKTRRLESALIPENAARVFGAEAAVARELVDLYHVANHTALGLADAFRTALGLSDAFKDFDQKYRDYLQTRRSHKAERLADKREAALQAFVSDIAQLSSKQPVLLALDTAERLTYLQLGFSGRAGHAWEWLVESLDRWGNVVLLIAGRPAAGFLINKLEQKLGDNVKRMVIEPFSEQESLEYFGAAIEMLRSVGRDTDAVRVEGLEAEHRQVAHVLSGGVPILLSLIVDVMATEGLVPRALRRKYSDVARLMPDELASAREDLKGELIDRLTREPGGRPSQNTILALGRAPRGVDAELLSKLIGVSARDAEERLRRVRALSFVKSREGDPRVFLHDEMYDMLEERIYRQPDDREDARKALKTLLRYYREKLGVWRREMDALFAPAETEARADRIDENRLRELEARRARLQTDRLFYQLHEDPNRGFKLYYRFSREAILSSDSNLDAELEAELSTFVESPPKSQRKYASPEYREQLEGMLSIRPLPKAWAEKRYADGLAIAAGFRADPAMRERLARDDNTRWVVAAYEASCHAYIGRRENLQQALAITAAAIREAEDLLARTSRGASTDYSEWDLPIWRTCAVLALLYATRAYALRVHGQLNEAIENHLKAASLWSEVNLKVELARSLNDMGFAQALTGDLESALANVREGLRLRRELGYRAPVALSYNTLALVRLRANAFQEAQQLSKIALALSRLLEYKAGEGNALNALAEELRRYAMSDDTLDIERKIDLLRQARDYAEEALEIFKGSGEISRQVESLIEIGCAYREWARLRFENPSALDRLDRLTGASDANLKEAATLAEENDILYRALDAQVNRVWLGYFTDRDDIFEDGRREAERLIEQRLKDYLIVPEAGQPAIARDQAQPNLWEQIGKLHVAYGHRTFHLAQTNNAGLHEATKYYLLGLEYSALFSAQAGGYQRARDQIADRVRKLPASRRRELVRLVEELEKDLRLPGHSKLRELLQRRALWVSS